MIIKVIKVFVVATEGSLKKKTIKGIGFRTADALLILTSQKI